MRWRPGQNRPRWPSSRPGDSATSWSTRNSIALCWTRSSGRTWPRFRLYLATGSTPPRRRRSTGSRWVGPWRARSWRWISWTTSRSTGRRPERAAAGRSLAGGDPGLSTRRRRESLTGHRIGHRILERARLAPFAGGADPAVGPDLIDAPVDLQVIAVRVPKFHGNLASGPPPSLEDDRNASLSQPLPRLEDLVECGHLEREVVEAARRSLDCAADQRDAVMVGVAAEEHHAARHH